MSWFDDMIDEYNKAKNALRLNRQRQSELLELGGMPKKQDITVHDPNRVSKPTEILGMAICHLVEKEKTLLTELNTIRVNIENYLETHLTIEQQLCVQGRLLNGYSFGQLARELHYSKSQVRRIYEWSVEILRGRG